MKIYGIQLKQCLDRNIDHIYIMRKDPISMIYALAPGS